MSLRRRWTKCVNLITHDELFRNYPQLRNTRVRFMQMEDGVMGRYIRQTNTIQLNRSLRNAPESTLLHEVQHAIQSAEGFASGSNPEYWNREGTRRLDAADEAESRLREEYRQRLESDPVLADLIRRYNAGELTDAEFNRAYDEPIESDPEYADLERRIREAERDSLLYSTASDYDLYYNTAGEIEARDTASRRDLTREQRRQTAPDLGDEDTVFAEGSEDGYMWTRRTGRRGGGRRGAGRRGGGGLRDDVGPHDEGRGKGNKERTGQDGPLSGLFSRRRSGRRVFPINPPYDFVY